MPSEADFPGSAGEMRTSLAACLPTDVSDDAEAPSFSPSQYTGTWGAY